MTDLDNFTLKEVNGGSQESYDIGVQVGDAMRKALVIMAILSLFFL